MNTTISGASNATERATLSSLRDDIEQLITLTKENLLELQSSSVNLSKDPAQLNATATSNDGDDDPFAKEYALFKAELEAAEGPSIEEKDESVPQSSAMPDIAVSIWH